MNKAITIREASKGINKSKSRQVPGPDGLWSLHYKSFEEALLQPLQSIMNSILQGGKLP